jgi:RNA polymerase sigma factor (sigma-70 family)
MKLVAKAASGQQAGRLAERLAKHLTRDERSAYGLIPEHVDFVFHSSFKERDTWADLFGTESLDLAIPAWRLFPEVPTPSQTRRIYKALTRDEEVQLFLRYNFARYRLAGLIAKQTRRFSRPRALEMIRWHEQVLSLRSDLVSANMNLVVAMATRRRVRCVDFAEQVSEGSMALLRAIDKFDASRGFKFSTYVCRAVFKSFNRLATKTGQYSQRFGKSYEPEMEQSHHDEYLHDIRRADLLEDVREIVDLNAAELTDLEHSVLVSRFALNGRSRETLAQLGGKLGLSNERVRQIQKKAVAKIHDTLHQRYLVA